jgi:hypothetical protein
MTDWLPLGYPLELTRGEFSDARFGGSPGYEIRARWLPVRAFRPLWCARNWDQMVLEVTLMVDVLPYLLRVYLSAVGIHGDRVGTQEWLGRSRP